MTAASGTILCADLGNTRIHLALFPAGRPVTRLPSRIATAVYGSVAPSREAAFERECRRRGARVRKLGRDLPVPVRVRSGRAWKPGTDRLCNALAAFERMRRNCLVVDVGTAINLEVVSRRGELIGGLIAPGLGPLASALPGRAQLLPSISPDLRDSVGRDTVENLRAGLYASVRGTIRQAIELGRARVGRDAPVLGTGGGSRGFQDLFDEWDPLLTLRGVHLSWLRLDP